MAELTDRGIILSKPVEEIEGGFTTVPDGVYSVEFTAWKKVDQKEKGKAPYILFTERVVSDGEWKGSVISDRLSLTTEAEWRWKQIGAALGIISGTVLPHPTKFVGKRVNVEVAVDLYEDESGNKTKRNKLSNYAKYSELTTTTSASPKAKASNNTVPDFPE